jgi:O-methyltransferase
VRIWPKRRLETGEDLFGPSDARRGTRFARRWYERLSLPLAVLFLLGSPRIHASYAMTWPKRFTLGRRVYRNTKQISTLTSYRAHLAMAAKLLEMPPDVKGVVVECGCYLGGATANLSLVCDIVGRELIVYDSFEGLPPATEGDRYAKPEAEGFLRADLDAVKDNVQRWGVIDRCTFRKGWFEDTLPNHTEPVVLAFLDVDFQASLHTCVLELWPHLVARGYVFIDEYVFNDYCALFFSERWWRTYLDTSPPGLLGAGTGVPAGNYYLGPFPGVPIQTPASVAYTRKDFDGAWTYFPAAPEG